MLWLDQRYAALLAGRLRNYKRVDSYVFNFSCPDPYPFCGDSKEHRNKARGYLYRRGSGLRYKCHRCGQGMPFSAFIKQLDENMYREYLFEMNLGSGHSPEKPYDDDMWKMDPPEFKCDPVDAAQYLNVMTPGHPGYDYLVGRKIPLERVREMRWTEDFFALARSMFPGKYKAEKYQKMKLPMIVIPVYDAEGSIVGIQGRDLSGKLAGKYITCASDGSSLVYGIEFVKEGDIYVFEGPFDSTFIPNSIATLGGTMISDVLGTKINPKRFVIVYDNERRSIHTVKKIDKAIDAGFRVCIWPEKVELVKDVNDMILDGYTPEEIKLMIDMNTHHGLQAKIALNQWKRC